MIESSQNEAIKILRRVRRSRGAEVVLEGPHLVLEALRLGLRLEPVVATAEFLASAAGEEILARLPRPPLVAAAQLLEPLADADSPRGLLAVCSLPRLGLEGLTPRSNEVWLYLDRIQDPGNLGALARVAEGLGAAGLLFSPGCADPNHPRALRASAGSLLRVPVAVHVEPAAAHERFSLVAGVRGPGERGFRWVGLEAHAGALSLEELPFRGESTILALGAEGPGLSAATRAQLDVSVTIPLRGRLESLNVTVAAALVLAHLAPPLTPP